MFIVKQIKVSDVVVGDLIKSRDIENGIDRYRNVMNKMYPIVKDQFQIATKSGHQLCTSGTHPIAFFDGTKEAYKETRQIMIGDQVVTPKGYSIVEDIISGDDLYDQHFIDFTVDEDNNYYAGNEADKLILAHNSATLYYPIWHLEVEDMLVLKNNKGTEETRIRNMDYGVQLNKLFYERLITGGEITLFSPHDLPEMYEAFFSDYNKFKFMYETAERNTKLRKKKIKALELFTTLMQERKDTGRIYIMNVDNANTHSSFIESKKSIRQSNLCAEIDLPTVPMGSKKLLSSRVNKNEIGDFVAKNTVDGSVIKSITPFEDDFMVEIEQDASRIQLCTLSAINWGNIKQPSDFEKPCRLAVRALDELLDYQEYPVNAAKLSTIEHRPLGIGIINLAYWIAKNGFKYSDGSALAKLDEYTEAWSYYLIKASVDLAKEKGACKNIDETKYYLGIMPIDTRKTDVDTLVPHIERMNWEQLRQDAKTYGIRNATLMALMPSECQHWANKLALSDGRNLDFHELMEDMGFDWESIEEYGIPQRYALPKPFSIKTRNGDKPVYEVYYNGVQDIYEVEFEDNTYRFSGNHALLVNRNGIEQWIVVENLSEGDDIISV